MIHRRMIPRFGARLATLTLVAVAVLLTSTGCSNNDEQKRVPAPPAGQIEVVGTLVALEDGRPYDAGIELTLETREGTRERVRVPSAFTAGPRDSVLAMHQVVDAAKVGNRLRARGTRDETGALRPQVLELIR